ncbi:MAG: archease [Methanobacteriaceae archaeon]|uniref:archease n=1 Tax=Methanobrevibacter TaxID=2172 RepID=UPI002A13E5BF|nr:archease [Methanobacteriaceae archaeon]MDD3408646.1 archease [Methanobacteriaceae archaeon]MDD4593763.1 archease [Methanobacteriaceae archaeon]
MKPSKDLQKQYEFFDVTADVGFWAFGRTINEAYQNASLAMFEVMTDTKKVNQIINKKITIQSEDKVSLLYDYLEELLFLEETEFLFFSKFDLMIKKSFKDDEISYELNGTIWGEHIDWDKHERRSEVKAVTFHLMDVIEDDLFKVRVILDL